MVVLSLLLSPLPSLLLSPSAPHWRMVASLLFHIVATHMYDARLQAALGNRKTKENEDLKLQMVYKML